MPLALILPRGDQWYLLRKTLIRRDKGVCVCVFFPFILDIKFVGRTSRDHTGGRSYRIFHPPSFCGACLNFSREKDSAIPFPRRPWSRILCTNDLIVLHSLGIFFFFFFFSEKNSIYRVWTHVPTCQKVTRLPLSYRGDQCRIIESWNSNQSANGSKWTSQETPYHIKMKAGPQGSQKVLYSPVEH